MLLVQVGFFLQIRIQMRFIVFDQLTDLSNCFQFIYHPLHLFFNSPSVTGDAASFIL